MSRHKHRKRSLPCEEYGSEEIQQLTDEVTIHREDVTGRRFVVYALPGNYTDRKALRRAEVALLRVTAERDRLAEALEVLRDCFEDTAEWHRDDIPNDSRTGQSIGGMILAALAALEPKP